MELKGEGHPSTGHKDSKCEYSYVSTLSLTSALEEVDCQRHVPANLPPGKTRCPMYRRLDGHQDRSGRVRNILSPPGFDRRTVQTPVANPYTI